MYEFDGGAKGIRTPDLFHAMEARYQLRHSPVRDLIEGTAAEFAGQAQVQVIGVVGALWVMSQGLPPLTVTVE